MRAVKPTAESAMLFALRHDHSYQGALAMPSAESWSSTLVCRFVADVLGRTLDITDDAEHKRALQDFVNELRPWMPPVNGPARSQATLFSRMDLDEDTGQVSVVMTPEGLACFRGWLRRQGLDPAIGTS
jgi:hypothetical protein